jgi:hypothetical protein
MTLKKNRYLLCVMLFFATILLPSCGANWHLQRAIKKDPSILQQKTITVTDTVVTDPTAVLDTVTISNTDTVEIVKNNFRVKIMRSFDTLIIDGGCDADTVVRTVRVDVPQIVFSESRLQRVQRYTFWGLLSLLLIALGLLTIRKSIKL